MKHLFVRHGIATLVGQRQTLLELQTVGFVIATFKRTENRVKAQGLRTPRGRPSNVVWVDEEQSDMEEQAA